MQAHDCGDGWGCLRFTAHAAFKAATFQHAAWEFALAVGRRRAQHPRAARCAVGLAQLAFAEWPRAEAARLVTKR